MEVSPKATFLSEDQVSRAGGTVVPTIVRCGDDDICEPIPVDVADTTHAATEVRIPIIILQDRPILSVQIIDGNRGRKASLGPVDNIGSPLRCIRASANCSDDQV